MHRRRDHLITSTPSERPTVEHDWTTSNSCQLICGDDFIRAKLGIRCSSVRPPTTARAVEWHLIQHHSLFSVSVHLLQGTLEPPLPQDSTKVPNYLPYLPYRAYRAYPRYLRTDSGTGPPFSTTNTVVQCSTPRTYRSRPRTT